MKKTYLEQVADNRAKEAQKAASLGYTVEEWRQVQAENNKRKTYEAKVVRLRREVERLEQWLADHPTK